MPTRKLIRLTIGSACAPTSWMISIRVGAAKARLAAQHSAERDSDLAEEAHDLAAAPDQATSLCGRRA